MSVQISDLSVWLGTQERQILNRVSLSIPTGSSTGLVGESGSGKSTLARVLMRGLTAGRVEGTVLVEDQDVYRLDDAELREYRSHTVAMIGQNPRAAMNPVHRIEDFACEVLTTRSRITRAEARSRMLGLLADVGIHDPDRILGQYPHQLSGGMLQRVVIAAAIAAEPSLLIADEPTTALDVTTQAEVMAVLAEQTRKRQMSMLFITHDLDLVSAVSDRTAVMYAGRIVEEQPSDRLLLHPQHPYTGALGAARTRADVDVSRLRAIEGNPIAAYEAEGGCSFAPRCAYTTDQCRDTTPPLLETSFGRTACIRHEQLAASLASVTAVEGSAS